MDSAQSAASRTYHWSGRRFFIHFSPDQRRYRFTCKTHCVNMHAMSFMQLWVLPWCKPLACNLTCIGMRQNSSTCWSYCSFSHLVRMRMSAIYGRGALADALGGGGRAKASPVNSHRGHSSAVNSRSNTWRHN